MAEEAEAAALRPDPEREGAVVPLLAFFPLPRPLAGGEEADAVAGAGAAAAAGTALSTSAITTGCLSVRVWVLALGIRVKR